MWPVKAKYDVKQATPRPGHRYCPGERRRDATNTVTAATAGFPKAPTRATDPIDPTDPTDPIDPTDPTDAIDPTEPIDAIEPADAIASALKTDSSEYAEPTLASER